MKNLSKRIVAFCLSALLALGASSALAASIDLSALSFDELKELSEQITKEITSRAEWKEVTVPAGVYVVGVDIPAGYWTITATKKQTSMLEIGTALDANKTEIARGATISYAQITDPADSYYSYNPVSSVSWNLNNGDYICITDASVIFTPYVKTPLGF